MPAAALIALHDKGDNLFGKSKGRRPGPDRGLGPWGERRRDHARQGQGDHPGLHPGRTDGHPGGTGALGLTLEQALEHLGKTTCDIYLNESAYWRNVPAKVWGYYIGGYQVIKKWLSYRERDLLGRSLTRDEAREYPHMARRLAAIVLMEPALNENYQAMKNSCYPWPSLGTLP